MGIAPTLVNYGSDWGAFLTSPLMQEEIFGPVLPMCSYQDVDDVVRFVNENEKPLVVHIFTNSSAVSDKVVRGTSSGTAVVNDTMVWMANNCLPFGGVGNSGLGTKYHGRGSFECFSHMKSVMVKSMAVDLA